MECDECKRKTSTVVACYVGGDRIAVVDSDAYFLCFDCLQKTATTVGDCDSPRPNATADGDRPMEETRNEKLSRISTYMRAAAYTFSDAEQLRKALLYHSDEVFDLISSDPTKSPYDSGSATAKPGARNLPEEALRLLVRTYNDWSHGLAGQNRKDVARAIEMLQQHLTHECRTH